MKHLHIVAFIGIFYLQAYSQNSFSGTISCIDCDTDLEHVSVYFPQLEKGTVTDANGHYTIKSLPTGNFKLVVSHLGFKTFSQNLDIIEGVNKLDIQLVSSAIEMEEVVVSTPFHKLQRENVMKVEQAKVADLKRNGAFTLAEGITQIAGVETVSTGIGIGKPVIRGLSSNRVLVYAQNVRLENQQFGDEHGLGLSDAGVESVEVIKGPASLLYGSDALGGVLYLNPEQFAVSNSTEGDINFNYFSNTSGTSTNAGVRTSSDKLKFLARVGLASHADYRTGDDERVTNSRFSEKDLKTGIGYQSSNFKSELRYNYNYSELGIAEEIAEQSSDRKPSEPYQEIGNHILSSKTNVFFEKSSLTAILGYVFNNRKEFEEGEEGAALEMDLATFNYNLQYNLPRFGQLETILGLQGMHQTNTNSGEELLIPDATTKDIGVLLTSHLHLGSNSDIQFGLRSDNRKIVGEENGTPAEEGFIAALDQSFNSFNAALGYKINISESFIGRINTATGFRAPNLAELTSNGVHEGTNRYEIGNALLQNEKNFQIDLALEFQNEHFEFYINGFSNRINDYVFLEPNGAFVGEDPVFLYRQQDANLYGGEIGLHLHPHPLDWLHLNSSFQSVVGKLSDGGYLPLIPANSWTNTIQFEFLEGNELINSGYGFVTLRSFFNQNNNSEFETTTEGYQLLNIGFGADIVLLSKDVNINLSGNNLLNETYISHLSRLKSDGIANMGRNINLGIIVYL